MSSRTIQIIATTSIALGAVMTMMKAIGAIDLPWWAVTAPIWIFPALGLVALFAVMVMVCVMFGWATIWGVGHGLKEAWLSYRATRLNDAYMRQANDIVAHSMRTEEDSEGVDR